MSSITLEIPNADAEALLRFLQKVNAQEQCPSDPWEASRLESALEEFEVCSISGNRSGRVFMLCAPAAESDVDHLR